MLGKLFERRSNEKNDFSLDNEKLADLFGLNGSNLAVNGFNSLKEATVYICTKIRSESIGKLPLKLYKNKVECKSDELSYLLKLRPNKFMSAINFWKAIETQRALKGNAFAAIIRNKKGEIDSLIPIEADKVKIIVDDESLLSTNKIWYIVSDKGKQYKLFSDEMLHFLGDITIDGLAGIPPLEYLRCLVENGKCTQEFVNKFFRNGLSVKGIIQYVGDLNPEAKKVFIKEFENMSNGLANAHSVSMLPIGYQFQPISLSMADAQFLENAKLNYRQIAAVFGIKSHHLNDLERATHTNIAEQQNEFYIDTLQPMLTGYEQELNYKLLSRSEFEKGYYFKFNVDAILRTSLKDRFEAYRVGIQGSVLTPNEARGKEDLEPLAGGDKLLANGNIMPVEMAGKQYVKGGEDNGKGSKTGSEE